MLRSQWGNHPTTTQCQGDTIRTNKTKIKTIERMAGKKMQRMKMTGMYTIKLIYENIWTKMVYKNGR